MMTMMTTTINAACVFVSKIWGIKAFMLHSMMCVYGDFMGHVAMSYRQRLTEQSIG